MPIRVPCSKCQTVFNVADDKIGKLIRCSKCQTVFRAEAPTMQAVDDIPEVEAAPKPAAKGETTVTPAPSPPLADVVAAAPTKEKKRSKVPFVLGGCAAVLFLLFAACGIGGYFFYVKVVEVVESVRTAFAQFGGQPNSPKPTQEKTPNDNTKVDDKKPGEGATYTLKIKSLPSAGKVTRIASTETVKGSVKQVIGDREQTTFVNSTKEDVHTCVVLEAGEPRPQKFKETYEKAASFDRFQPIFPYQGRTVTYDLQGDNYRVTAPGDFPLLAKHVEALARHARLAYLDAVLLPNKPVHVGDTWTPDVKALSERYFNHLEINVADSKANAKLDKVKEKDGKQSAVVALDLELSIVKMGWLPPGATGTLKLQGTQEFPLDGSDTTSTVSLTGKMTAHYIDVPLMQAVCDLTADLTLKEERSSETVGAEVPVDAGWQKVESQLGKYSAEFPGKTKVTGSRTEFTDDKGVVYSVQMGLVRPPLPTTTQQLLDLVLLADAAKATDRKDLTLGDNFGVEFTVERSALNAEKTKTIPVRVRERAYLVKNHRYEIKVQSPKDVQPPEEDVKRFLDSFKLTEAPK